MKVRCNREMLLAAYQTAATVAPTRSPKPILQNVQLDARSDPPQVMATDMEVGVRIVVPGIEVETPGSAILPLGRFGSILREGSDEQLSIEADGQGTTVRGERSEFKLPAENPEEFPHVATFEAENYLEISARCLREMIRRTIFATDNESSRYALGGVLLELGTEKITGVATDGRRLAKAEFAAKSVGESIASEAMTIVPTKAMQLIERALTDPEETVQIAVDGSKILVHTPRATIHAQLVEGRFPRWREVFPQRTDAARIELVVGPVLSAVRQAAIVTSDDSRGVDFVFKDGSLILTARAAERGESRIELPVPYDGAELGISLDPRYLLEFLKVLDPEKSFTFELQDSKNAAVCFTDDDYGYVIMPLARDA